MQLRINGLTKRYGDHTVLDNIDLDVENSHALVILGPSGGGKTTLLRIIAGLLAPEAGTLEVNGRKVTFDEEHMREYRKRVGMVFQAYNLFPHLTALENIKLPLIQVHRKPEQEAEEIAVNLLRRFQLEVHMHKRPGQLSGGQKQRIALSRAIAISPEFLLLDEPTSALDPELTAEVLDMIEELRSEDKHLVLVTHHMGFARSVSDMVVFIADGRIVESGPPEALFDNSADPQVRRFFDKVLRH